MKPSLDLILEQMDGLDPVAVSQHLDRLPEDYFERFPLADVAEHIRRLQGLDKRNPVDAVFHEEEDGSASCTVLAFDYPAEFSVISGLLAGYGFSILAGDIYTYSAVSAPETKPRRRRTRSQDTAARRRIVDHFSGRAGERLQVPGMRDELVGRLKEVVRLLEEGGEAAIEKAKRIVIRAVVSRLEHLQMEPQSVLYPMEIDMEEMESGMTRLKVVSQDTPAFLYALSNALSVQGLSIERVRIRTVSDRIEDTLEISSRSGRSLTDSDLRDRIRLSVLLTKQFTYFLPAAPDPFAALLRFEQLVGDLVKQPDREDWLETISNPHAMRDLARVLGASDFLWEDFIRLQYESLLPLLEPHVGGQTSSTSMEGMRARLAEAIAGCTTQEEKIDAINRFKDREAFLIDLDHILLDAVEFKELSRRLAWLAELVVGTMTGLVYEEMKQRHGEPQTVGGLPARYAVMGLGKLGGVALGYASDIELLFVYSDTGRTGGENAIGNAEFFSTLAREATRAIAAKREGIFEVDMRLRPHGASGPLACSLENFCKYYGPSGQAHSYERLALVRMRLIAGDETLGRQLERVRDEFVYASRQIDLQEIHALRARQAEEKNRPGSYNAKFSPGALVDMEYAVQLLQVEYGAEREELRTPRMRPALAGLRKIGILDADELERLIAAYDFLRKLINGLRMLRGSAKDLFLPQVGSDEYVHLARRMGYKNKGELRAEEQLHLDFETCTAAVRAFVEKHYGREFIPGPVFGNVADVLLSRDKKSPLMLDMLRNAGFDNPEQALTNLQSLAGEGRRHEVFLSLAILACDHLTQEPASCMALNNWERFVSGLDDPLGHFELLMAQPRRLDILLGIFSRSQFLADTLIRYAGFLNWVTDPETLRGVRDRAVLSAELSEWEADAPERDQWIAALSRFRQREMLRIGTRDMILQAPIAEITRDLSILADTVLDAALRRAWRRIAEEGRVTDEQAGLADRFYLLGLGKLGGEELNYSSDIDLIAGFRPSSDAALGDERTLLIRLLDEMREDLTRHTADGHAYRVDFRLRPYGSAGERVQTTRSMLDYYEEKASLWEIQAMLKARIVAGSESAGQEFLRGLESVLRRPRSSADVVQSILSMRDAAIQHVARNGQRDVKTGIGGIRDIEFLVQGYQLAYVSRMPELLGGNTLVVLRKMEEGALIDTESVRALESHYVFLRRVEHCLQILEDRQIHALPTDEFELERLAGRVLGAGNSAQALERELNGRQEAVRLLYERGLEALSDNNVT